MRNVVTSLAVALAAVSSASANFYAGGSINHHNDRYKSTDVAGAADTNRVGLNSLGVSLNAGYMMEKDMILGGEFEVGYNNGKINAGDSSVKSPLHLSLVGKVGHMINTTTGLYGNVGIGYERISVGSGILSVDSVTANQINLILGAGITTALTSNAKLFMEYNYNLPLNGKSTDAFGKFKKESQTFKVGARYFFN